MYGRVIVIFMLSCICVHAGTIPKVIFDTDMTGDCDDLGALAVAHALADNGELELLGCIASYGGVPYVAGCIDAINTYYGRPDLPIGAEPEDFGRKESSYLEPIATDQERYKHDVVRNTDVPDHVTVYRQLLAAQPDHSVTIITVGRLKGLHDLLVSAPDAISELDGVALVQQKSVRWVCMGGNYPNLNEQKAEANLSTHGGNLYAKKAIEAWPLPIIFTGFEIGVKIQTGTAVIEQSDENPVARGYRLWFNHHLGDKKPYSRASWDQTAVLLTARGTDTWWDVVSTGYNHVHDSGVNEWRDTPDKEHSYLVQKASPDEVATVISALMCQPPK